MHRLISYTTGFLLIVLLSTSFFVRSTNTYCQTSVSNQQLMGGTCTAETISVYTTWIQQSPTAILPTKELFLLGFLSVCLSLFIKNRYTKKPLAGFTWFNQQLVRIRTGPAPHGRFIPYLYATHGW